MSEPNGLVASGARHRLRQRLGGYGSLLRWYRRFRPQWLWRRISPLGAASIRFVEEYGLTVRHGAFEGMVFPPSALGTSGFLPAKLLGCYEAEVMGTIESIETVDTFVDIGSGDGYYPVGVGRRFPDADIIGFETDERDRRLAAEIARLNGISITVNGTAGPADLNRALPTSGRLLILCDIEGAEREVLDPDAVPRLRSAQMIVELHPRVVPDIEATLTARFGATHSIEVVHGRDRSVGLTELRSWSPEEANYAVTDGRASHGVWMVLDPESPRCE